MFLLLFFLLHNNPERQKEIRNVWYIYIHLKNHYIAYRKGRRVRDPVVVEFISTCVCTYEISSYYGYSYEFDSCMWQACTRFNIV